MTHGTPDAILKCPYCSRPLQWVPLRWFGRGCFACEQCGEFPDLGGAGGGAGRVVDHAASWSSRVPPPHDDRPRVLLVDDSVEHRDLYALMLEPTATVLTASRGEDALAIAASELLDAIVLDVLMPGMDGWEVCRRLKSSLFTADIPVILLTSLDGLDVTTRAYRAGAAAVLMKPCPVERLAMTIDAAVQRRSARTTRPRAASVSPERSTFGRSRRWTRKPVGESLLARIDEAPAHLVNVSYGGLCVSIVRAPNGPTFDVTFPGAQVAVRAETVWMSRGQDRKWLCGAEIAQRDEAWRRIVDTAPSA